MTFQNRFHALRKKRNNARASQQVHEEIKKEKILEQPLAPVKKEREEKPKLYRPHKKLKKRSTLIPPKQFAFMLDRYIEKDEIMTTE